jgi:cardiolipin synthase
MTLPNLITLGRFALVPLAVWGIAADRWLLAFWVFAAAGASDAVDGYVARRFNLRSPLGAILDPLADKVLLVSIFLMLGVTAVLPLWLVLLVVGRDLAIVVPVIVLWWRGSIHVIAPLLLSKVNTAVQIVFVGLLLFLKGQGLVLPWLVSAGSLLVAALTIASAAAYVREDLRRRAASRAEVGRERP